MTGVSEYRLADLVQLTGVSARNIRSYQERGLIHPPRRQGRVAIYDEDHRVQLQIITQLLQRGYALSHIQDFFEGFAKNLDLADVLGVRALAKQTGMHDAFTAPWRLSGDDAQGDDENGPTAPVVIAVDPSSKVARTLCTYGLAKQVGADLAITDAGVAGVLAGFKDQAFGLRVLAGVCEATAESVERLAKATIGEVGSSLVEHYGEGWIPPADEQRDLAATITDVRRLASHAVDHLLGAALKDNEIRAVGAYMEGIMTTQRDD